MLYLMVHFEFDVNFKMLSQMVLTPEETPSSLENINLKKNGPLCLYQ